MDFMNLNQSAHGDREFGFVETRMGLRRKTVVGHWRDPQVAARIGVWARAAAGWREAQALRVARFGDNMRDVAVTEGDKVEAQIRFGVSVNGYGVGDPRRSRRGVAERGRGRRSWRPTRTQYDLAPRSVGRRASRVAARRRADRGRAACFLDAGGFQAFTDTFEDLDGLAQLPGIAAQRLMAEGYGFAAEGDWKTAALVRIAKVMSSGLDGGTSFMEDYTYDLAPEGPAVLGAHMLEVCPSIAAERPSCEIHPLSIGGKADPVRLVFTAAPGPAVLVGLLDLGDRFRLVLNEVELVQPPEDLPRLPVARALWRPEPDFPTAAEAWLRAGGPHHTVLCRAIGTEAFVDLAEIAGIELLVIDERTRIRDIANELRWNQAYYRLARGHVVRHAALQERVLEANLALGRAGLVVLTFGNASAIDREAGIVAIKPSGVSLDSLGVADVAVVDLATGAVVEGDLRPSSDTPTHLALYRAWRDVGGIVHTHSPFATAWAQARLEIPCYGTTHADHFDGAVPVTRLLTSDEIEGEYERATGDVIVETFATRELVPLGRPAVLVASHGPFAWGATEKDGSRERDRPRGGRGRRISLGRTRRKARADRAGAPSQTLLAQARSSGLLRPADVKALRLHGACDLRLHEEPDPEPHAGQVLVRVGGVGLCGSDRHWFLEGGIGDAVLGEPLVLGHEFAGVVTSGPRTGQRVVLDPAVPCGRCTLCSAGDGHLCSELRFAGHGSTDGGLRTLVAWPERLAYPLPDSVSDEAAPLLEPLGVALHAIDLGGAEAGTTPVSSAADRSAFSSCRRSRPQASRSSSRSIRCGIVRRPQESSERAAPSRRASGRRCL